MRGYSTANAAYTEAAVMTASPERLVVMLFEGALGFLARAGAAVRIGDQKRANENVRRTIAIIDELNLTLDMSQGEISTQLRSIYLFCKRQLTLAGVTGDAAQIETIAGFLDELRTAFAEIADRALVPSR
jgi:flagellar secretion chaperone FliS